jgi:hypothetical protein
MRRRNMPIQSKADTVSNCFFAVSPLEGDATSARAATRTPAVTASSSRWRVMFSIIMEKSSK